ncbi:MAG: restriction endonuclease subunit S [Synergistaceae bacterium]|nr:restriction endonuclease subunit S [Synergistaceae bacterium]
MAYYPPPPSELLRLDSCKWRIFYIKDIFTITSGKRLRKEDMTPGDVPFVGASDSNNGVTSFVSNSNPSEDSNVLGVNYNGSVVENFYHPYKALFSDDVKRFHIKGHKGNKYIYLFLKTIISQQKNKYNYGYKFNDARMREQIIMLPVNEEGKPDWDFMEN